MPETLTFTDEDMKGGNYLIQPGVYEVAVATATEETSKKGNQMTVVTLVDVLTRRERKEFLPHDLKWKVAQFAKSCGYTPDEIKAGLTLPTAFASKKLTIQITTKGKETYDGKERDKIVVDYLAPGTDAGTFEATAEDIPF